MLKQLREIDNENINLADFQIQELAPVLDRHSPTAISLALFFHQKVAKHAGADRSHLSIQGTVFIFQGQKLFEDICRDCITCRIKLKQKYNQIILYSIQKTAKPMCFTNICSNAYNLLCRLTLMEKSK